MRAAQLLEAFARDPDMKNMFSTDQAHGQRQQDVTEFLQRIIEVVDAPAHGQPTPAGGKLASLFKGSASAHFTCRSCGNLTPDPDGSHMFTDCGVVPRADLEKKSRVSTRVY